MELTDRMAVSLWSSRETGVAFCFPFVFVILSPDASWLARSSTSLGLGVSLVIRVAGVRVVVVRDFGAALRVVAAAGMAAEFEKWLSVIAFSKVRLRLGYNRSAFSLI